MTACSDKQGTRKFETTDPRLADSPWLGERGSGHEDVFLYN